MQPLPEKVAAIEALEPPKDIDKLRQFLGLVGFYRKFIPFYGDVTACLNTMLRKGAVFKWTQQCGNAFELLKSEVVKMLSCNIQILISHLCCSQMHPNIVFLAFSIKRKHHTIWVWRSTSFQWHTLQAHLVGPNSCGTQPSRSVMQFTGPLKICTLLNRYKMHTVL